MPRPIHDILADVQPSPYQVSDPVHSLERLVDQIKPNEMADAQRRAAVDIVVEMIGRAPVSTDITAALRHLRSAKTDQARLDESDAYLNYVRRAVLDRIRTEIRTKKNSTPNPSTLRRALLLLGWR